MIKPQLFDVITFRDDFGHTVIGQTAFEHIDKMSPIYDMWVADGYTVEEMYRPGQPREFYCYVWIDGIQFIVNVEEEGEFAPGHYNFKTPTIEPLFGNHGKFYLMPTDDDLDPEKFHGIRHYIKETSDA